MCTSPYRLLAASVLLALFNIAQIACGPALAQAPSREARPHDEDAVARKAIEGAEAPDGWWTRSMKSRDERLGWWREARFGCFMHWGVYSVLGGEYEGQPVRGYAEHIQRIRKIDQATYRRVAVETFNPTQFNADAWADLLQRAGMRYLIITSKHHDGFAMFDSDVSPENVVDATPFARDPMRELRDACRRRDIHFGFYYSQAFDWGEADGAGNDWEFQNPGGDKKLGGDQWWETMPGRLERVREKYVDAKSIPQIRELIAKYDPDILWFDTSSKLPFSENLRILKAIRAAAPNVVVNGRLARGYSRNFGDYVNTGDRAEELSSRGDDWEAIPTTNESYGYHKHDPSYKPPTYFIQLLAKAVSRNGNMLLNVGPRGDGKIDEPDVAILEAIGRWTHAYGESIYGCGLTPLAIQPWGVSTYKEQQRVLYLHVFDWPRDGRLTVGGLATDPKSVELLSLGGAAALEMKRLNSNDLEINVPATAPSSDDSVIRLKFSGPVAANAVRLLGGAGYVDRLLTFDAERSRGMGVGDGKRDRYFVTGMNSPDKTLNWRVRLNAPATFAVDIRYAAGEPHGQGTFVVESGGQRLTCESTRPDRDAPIRQESLGELSLPAGTHEIRLSSPDVTGGEIGRPLELRLTAKPSSEN